MDLRQVDMLGRLAVVGQIQAPQEFALPARVGGDAELHGFQVGLEILGQLRAKSLVLPVDGLVVLPEDRRENRPSASPVSLERLHGFVDPAGRVLVNKGCFVAEFHP